MLAWIESGAFQVPALLFLPLRFDFGVGLGCCIQGLKGI